MTVTVAEGRIVSVDGDRGADIEASVIAPGLIDLQYNGGFGVEIGDSAGSILHVAERLPRTGVTAFLPTLVTSPPDVYAAAFAAFDEAARAPARGARPLGMHLEGPFLAPLFAGAHDREWLERADPRSFDALLGASGLAMMTLAPERPGALDRIARLAARGVVASIGHTAATYDEVLAGIDAGATMVTHLFNAMSPFTHRAPGAVGAALLDPRVTCGLIVDGVHAHDGAIHLALRSKGASKIALVTDAMSAAGSGPGVYELAGKRVNVDATSARLDDGTLAGSILTLDGALRNIVALGVPLEHALRMATEIPARLLGLSTKGRLSVGSDADIVLFDDALDVRATLVAGAIAYAAS